MKKLVLMISMTFLSVISYGQKLLEVDDSAPVSVFATDKEEALVVIRCDSALNLGFKTNWNEPIVYYKEPVMEMDKKIYQILFPMDKKAYKEKPRTLSIMAAGYDGKSISLSLTPKMKKTISVTDPNSGITGCYYQLSKDAQELFVKGMYNEAKSKYQEATKCKLDYTPDREKEVNAKIKIIDSINRWKAAGDSYLSISKYYQAITEYQKILSLNPVDAYAQSRMSEAQTKQNQSCSSNFALAATLFEDKDYVRARELYKTVTDEHCNNAPEAHKQIKAIDDLLQLPHVLTYEYSENVPIGISTGRYKNRKAGGYFTLRFNPEVFEILRSNHEITAKPELNLSFGWTLKIVKPIWIFFTPFGYTGVGSYVLKNPEGETGDNTELELKLHHAISPEVGLVGKIPLGKKFGIALRYTFQYRYAFEKESSDYIGTTRHVFGAGFNF